MRKALPCVAAFVAAAFVTSPSFAGAFIIDGTDADDHGFASGGVNQEGWFYIQRGLENIAASSSVTRTQKTIAVLGADPFSQAGVAVQSAVDLSSALSSAGWTISFVNGAAAINSFFANSGTGLKSSDASILYMSSWDQEVGGGISGSEQTAIDANATAINSFLGSGGGLFSHVQGYGWLSTLIPGLTVVYGGDQGIKLTTAGTTNFPGLSDADLSSGPYHANFRNTGVVPVLGVDDGGFLAGEAVIIGGGGGTITNPNTPSIPEPASWAMMVGGFGAVGGALRRRRTSVRFA